MIDRQSRADIKSYVDMVRGHLSSLGLSMELDPDMAAFKSFYNAQPARLNFPTTLDADFSVIPADSFWLKIRTDAGDIVACHGQKIFHTDDFVQDLHLHTAYADRPSDLSKWSEVPVYPEVERLEISGRIVIGGGLWIHPDWRGKGLMLFNRANRALSLWFLRPDWFVGWLDYRPSRLNMAKAANGAGYAHAVPLSDDIYPPTVYVGKPAKPRPMLLAWSSADEWLSLVKRELREGPVADAEMHRRSPPPSDGLQPAPSI